MPLYKFRAVSASGQTMDGTDTANNKMEVVQRLREKNNYPLIVEEVVQKDIKDIHFFGNVGLKHIAVFCRQFHTLLNAGVTIVNSLDILKQQVENKKFRIIINELYEDVQKGFTFSEALEKHSDVFPTLMTQMVAAGEVSGTLDSIMFRMADHYEKEHKINNRIKSAMVYPIILAVVATLVVVFLLTYIMPTFFEMFADSGVPIPLPTRIMLGISNGIRDYWYVILFAITGFVYLVKRYISTDDGREVLDRWKLRIPLVKGLTTKIISARFSRTLSVLLASGIPLLQALENVSRTVNNKIVGKAILDVGEDVKRGVALSVPIRKTGLFPPMIDNMIRIGEESGTLDEIMEKTANFYDEEVEQEIQRILTFLEPILIVVMGVIVGFIVVSMIMPLYDMLQTI